MQRKKQSSRDDESGTRQAGSAHGVAEEIDRFLQGKSKAQLIALIRELAGQYPEVAQDLADRQRIVSGEIAWVVERLYAEIQDLAARPGWQTRWDDEGYTPDYSPIRNKLEVLLKEGHADEVLLLGREILTAGVRQVEQSDDEGETALQIASCVPVIVAALDRSSLDSADRLMWALDAVLEDDYDLCRDLADYLEGSHPRSAWQTVADRLLARLAHLKSAKGVGEFERDYARDALGDWAIVALEGAGREDEIIPLCEAEATETSSYGRLVALLIAAERYQDAEHWIRKGCQATQKSWPGIAAGLRDQLRGIRVVENDWAAVTALLADEFVRHPSTKTFGDCKAAADKVEAWPKVREYLLNYMEKGDVPWEQEGWPLPATSLDTPERERQNGFPMIDERISIAILEKKPDQVLHWYDRLSEQPHRWHTVDEDRIASAIQVYAPDRAVALWQAKAESLIARVEPRAYREAATYLGKAGALMANRGHEDQWQKYVLDLRQTHARKRRLIEILDGLQQNPGTKKRR